MTNGTPWHVPGKWFVNPLHWAEQVRAQMPNLPEKIFVKDATIQEAADCVGSMISWGDRLTLAGMLSDIGVSCIKMPHDVSLQEVADFIKALDREGVDVEKSYTGPVRGANWKERLQRQIDTGIDTEEILFMPDGFEPSLFARSEAGEQQPLPKERIFELIHEVVNYVKKQGVKVAFSWPDTTRSDLETVKECYSEAVRAGAERVYVWDSTGCSVPSAVRYLIAQLREVVGETPICAQFHNDLGMATANTITAVENGVTWVDTTVNGIGDRAGNAAFEEVICTLEFYGIHTGISLNKFYELSKFVEKAYGIPKHSYKPIVGETCCIEEAHYTIGQGAIKEGMLEAPMGYNPELVGRAYRNVFGTTTLYRGGVELKLAEWGFNPTDEQLREIMLRAHESIGAKRYIEEEEFKIICEGVLLGKPLPSTIRREPSVL